MNTDDNIFHKCGEVFITDTETISFLCYFCNELFSDFSVFRSHSVTHLHTDASDKKLRDFNAISDSVGKNCIQDILKECCDVQLKHEAADYDNDVDFDECGELLDFVNKSKPDGEIQNSNDKLKKDELSCPHCKQNYKVGLHDMKKCKEVLQMMNQHNGEFVKMLRENALYCYCKKRFEDYKKLYEHHLKLSHCYCKTVCIICKFHDFMDAKKDMKKEDSNILFKENSEQDHDLYCTQCFIKFDTISDYCLHLETVHKDFEPSDDEPYNNEEVVADELQVSDESSESEKEVRKRRRRRAKKSSPEKTEKKEKKEKEKSDNGDSTEGKSDEPIKCDFCDKVFKNMWRKKLHMRIHENYRPYSCEQCPSTFTTNYSLRTHIIYKHTTARPFVCRVEGCGKAFKLYEMRRQHEKIHLPAKYQCEMCGNSYKAKIGLEKHQKSKHVQATNWGYECEVCHRRFALKEYLRDHKRIHTGEKPFGCDVCHKYFRIRSALRQHKKLHSDERKYVCKLCGKAFKQGSGYWSHMKRHPVD